jgi:hypothetical protein
VGGQVQQPTPPGNAEAAEEVSALQTAHAASQSNGSSQSKRPKRNVRSTYARDSATEATSPVNSQGGVTSSSPDENGASTAHVKNDPKVKTDPKDGDAAAADTSIPESPAVIDAEHHESKTNAHFQTLYLLSCKHRFGH